MMRLFGFMICILSNGPMLENQCSPYVAVASGKLNFVMSSGTCYSISNTHFRFFLLLLPSFSSADSDSWLSSSCLLIHHPLLETCHLLSRFWFRY